jgi:hypothetical protein
MNATKLKAARKRVAAMDKRDRGSEVVRPCVLAGTSEEGVCPRCGTPWRRVVERERKPTRPGVSSKVYAEPPVHPDSPVRRHSGDVCGNRDPQRHCTVTTTTGWHPGCDCGEKAVPALVIDPFTGAGTTGLVAVKYGRRFHGPELNPEYAEMARRRIGKAAAAPDLFRESVAAPMPTAEPPDLFTALLPPDD